MQQSHSTELILDLHLDIRVSSNIEPVYRTGVANHCKALSKSGVMNRGGGQPTLLRKQESQQQSPATTAC